MRDYFWIGAGMVIGSFIIAADVSRFAPKPNESATKMEGRCYDLGGVPRYNWAGNFEGCDFPMVKR